MGVLGAFRAKNVKKNTKKTKKRLRGVRGSGGGSRAFQAGSRWGPEVLGGKKAKTRKNQKNAPELYG